MRRYVPFSLVAFVLLFQRELTALTLKSISLEELSQTAPRIVSGTVTECEVRSTRNQIRTYCTIDVDETLKGERSETVCTQQVGGFLEKEGYGVKVPGQVMIREGEELIVFLSDPDEEGCSRVRASNQGIYRIEEGNVLLHDRGGAHILGTSEVPSPQTVIPRKQFMELIESYIDENGEQR